MVISTCTFLGSRLTPHCDITSPKNGMLVHWNRHLSFWSFKLACLHICRTLLSVAIWSLPVSSNPAIRISSAMPNMFGIPWNSSSIFHRNVSLVGATSEGNHIYLYLPKVQEKVVKYDDCSSSIKL